MSVVGCGEQGLVRGTHILPEYCTAYAIATSGSAKVNSTSSTVRVHEEVIADGSRSAFSTAVCAWLWSLRARRTWPAQQPCLSVVVLNAENPQA